MDQTGSLRLAIPELLGRVSCFTSLPLLSVCHTPCEHSFWEGRTGQVGSRGCWIDRQEGWIKGQVSCYSLGNEVQGASGRENGKIKERRKLVREEADQVRWAEVGGQQRGETGVGEQP